MSDRRTFRTPLDRGRFWVLWSLRLYALNMSSMCYVKCIKMVDHFLPHMNQLVTSYWIHSFTNLMSKILKSSRHRWDRHPFFYVPPQINISGDRVWWPERPQTTNKILMSTSSNPSSWNDAVHITPNLQVEVRQGTKWSHSNLLEVGETTRFVACPDMKFLSVCSAKKNGP